MTSVGSGHPGQVFLEGGLGYLVEDGGWRPCCQSPGEDRQGQGSGDSGPGSRKHSGGCEGRGVCSDVSRLSHWQMVVIFQETGNAGLGARGNSHVSGRYLRAILEGKQMIIGSTGENIPAGGAYLSVSGCELS